MRIINFVYDAGNLKDDGKKNENINYCEGDEEKLISSNNITGLQGGVQTVIHFRDRL